MKNLEITAIYLSGRANQVFIKYDKTKGAQMQQRNERQRLKANQGAKSSGKVMRHVNMIQ